VRSQWAAITSASVSHPRSGRSRSFQVPADGRQANPTEFGGEGSRRSCSRTACHI